LDLGKDNVLFIHVTLLPFIKASEELKTKPTQHSVGKLREIGINPDIIICRSERPVSAELKAKISLFCSVHRDAVVEAPDAATIYEVPLLFQRGLRGRLGKAGASRGHVAFERGARVVDAHDGVPVGVGDELHVFGSGSGLGRSGAALKARPHTLIQFS